MASNEPALRIAPLIHMEGALHETASMRLLARLSGLDAIPDETTTLNFRPLFHQHEWQDSQILLAHGPLEAASTRTGDKATGGSVGSIAPEARRKAGRAGRHSTHPGHLHSLWLLVKQIVPEG